MDKIQNNSHHDTIILGLTGSIGMGKSTAAQMLREENIPVFDSDAVVHKLMDVGGDAVEPVLALFPDVCDEHMRKINRAALGKIVFNDKGKLAQLEGILHPLVRLAQAEFYKEHSANDARIICYDIPLLYETKAQARMDYTMLVTAPYKIQRERVMARAGMTEEKFAAILESQISDDIKRKLADFIIPSGAGYDVMRRALRGVVGYLLTAQK
jgi:dephospho-CoA kinase